MILWDNSLQSPWFDGLLNSHFPYPKSCLMTYRPVNAVSRMSLDLVTLGSTLNNFQIYYTAVFTIVTVLYITSSVFITVNLYLLITVIQFPPPTLFRDFNTNPVLLVVLASEVSILSPNNCTDFLKHLKTKNLHL